MMEEENSEEVIEEGYEESEKVSAEASEGADDVSEDGVDAEDDLDSLMSEVVSHKSENSSDSSADLSSLVSTSDDKEEEDLDSMLDSTDDVEAPMDEGDEGMSIEFLLEMPLTVTFEVGRAKMEINNLLSLGQGSVLELHRLVGETLDLMVNNRLIARGEVVVINEKFGARLTEIIPPEERIKRMGGMDQID